MHSNRASSRLFSGQLDRAAFSVYFAGAIVPLVALGLVVDRYALPHIDSRGVEIGLVGLVVFAALLSLGAFVLLQRMTRAALARMEGDNQRLARLLQSSSSLSAAQHVTDALGSACEQALALAAADAAYLFLKGEEADGPALSGTAGDGAEALYTEHAGAVEELVRVAVETARPAVRSSVGSGLSPGGGLAVAAVPLPTDAVADGALVVVQRRRGFEPGEVDALSALAGLAGVALHNADLRDAQRNFFSHVTDMLVTALDSHVGFQHGHGQRVAQLANRLGRAVDLDDEAMQRLHFAALLHDVGMLKLDRNQHWTRATCDKHTLWGYRMLARIRLWKDIAPIVYQHHEWFDGSGYPEGKAGEEISREARILALCDSVDAMTAESTYRDPLGREQALAELERCAGTQFDPELVEVFRELVEGGQIELALRDGA